MRRKDVIMNASILKRMLSLVLDLLLINLVVGYPLQSVIRNYFPLGSVGEIVSLVESSSRLTGLALLIMLSISLISFLYLTLFEWKLSQTPGMMLLGLRVVSDGELTYGKCILRSLFIFPFFPFYLLWIIEPLYMFFRGGQRMTEYITDTSVAEEMRRG